MTKTEPIGFLMAYMFVSGLSLGISIGTIIFILGAH